MQVQGQCEHGVVGRLEKITLDLLPRRGGVEKLGVHMAQKHQQSCTEENAQRRDASATSAASAGDDWHCARAGARNLVLMRRNARSTTGARSRDC